MVFYLLSIFISLLFHSFCECDISIGDRVSISVPSTYKSGFEGRAYFIRAGEVVPSFKASLSIEALDGRYLCALVVLFGEMEVWNSRRFSLFFPLELCVLELMESGVLQLRDSSGRIGWRTGTSGQGVERLKLLRTGNLVLTDAKNNTKWQSFDFPAHIMLWGQRLYTPNRLTSLAADSTSLYSMEIQDEKIAMYLNSGSLNYSYWEFKPNKGQIIEFVELGSTGLKLFSKRHRKVAQISSNSLEPIRFLALGKTGNLEFYHYSLYKGKFEASFQVLNGTCDLPLTCGPYGICRSSNTCTCMRILNKTEHIQSECDEGLLDRFCESNVTVKMVELEGVTSVLRSAHPMINVSKEECISLCAADCSCASVLFSFGGVAGEQRECFHYQLVGGVKQVEREVGVSYLIKVPQELIDGRSRNSSGIKKWILIVGGVVNLLAVLLILGGVVWYISTRKRTKATPREIS